MSKAYIGDIGTPVQVNTFVDLTAATVKEYKIKKPDGSIETWTADIPDGMGASDGYLVHISEAGDFDQAGKYYLQVHVETASTDHLGDTVMFEVYDAFQ